MSNFKTVQLENGNIFAYYPQSAEVTIKNNGDYFCSDNGNLCFKRGSHDTIIKILSPKGKNVTFEIYYEK